MNILKYTLNISLPVSEKLLRLFVHESLILHTIFNTVHTISDVNSIFKDIGRIFTRIVACIDGQTDKPNA